MSQEDTLIRALDRIGSHLTRVEVLLVIIAVLLAVGVVATVAQAL